MKMLLLAGAGLAALLGVPAAAQDAPPPPPGAMAGPGGHGRDAMVDRLFAMMDTNHDGVVTRAEYDAFRAARKAEHEAREQEHRAREFDRLDTNHDGMISKAEFMTPPPPPPPPGMGADGRPGNAPPPPPPGDGMGGPPPPGGPGGMHGHRGMHGPDGMRGPGPMGPDWFDRADANHDGKVTLAEAKAFAEKMRKEHRMDRHGPGGPDGDMPPPPPQ